MASTGLDVGEEPIQNERNAEPSTSGNEHNETNDPNFECNICLDTAKEAVISMCGHLFW